MPFLVTLIVAAAAAFTVHVAVRYSLTGRPEGVSAIRRVWHTALETATLWRTWARDSLRGLPASWRAWRQGHRPAPAPAGPGVAAGGGWAALRERRNAGRPLPPVPEPGARARAATLIDGVPPDHALAADRLAAFVAENDTDLLAMLQGEARASYGYAEAWLTQAETQANELGLDLSIVQATAMVAEWEADKAQQFAGIVQRILQVYELPETHIAEGGTLPTKPDWLTGEGW